MKNDTNITKALLCELTEKERENYGIQLATTLEDIENVEAQKKRETDHFKDRIAGLQARASDIRTKVSSGQEWRDVECEVRLGQPDPAHKQVVRLDTGEVVETKAMTDADRQLVMELEEGAEDDSDEAIAEQEFADDVARDAGEDIDPDTEPMPEADEETPEEEEGF